MTRIGLFGGSFDPVHQGHLLIADAAMEALSLDRLFFIPAAQSPFKPERKLAAPAARVRWLRMALCGRTDCEVTTLELERDGVSYTIDTVREFTVRYPGAELHWLIGADHVATLPRWRDAAALADLAQFVIAPRPGGEPAVAVPPPFRAIRLEGPVSSISSSDVRERIREGRRLDGWVPDPVAEAVRNYPLYL